MLRIATLLDPLVLRPYHHADLKPAVERYMLYAVVGRPASRYIPAAVERELRSDARDRCSLSGHLIPFREANTDIESRLLELHHVIFFSQGGESTEDNLMLVCPNCHAKVHRYPERYPVERLREAKRLWARLDYIVPSRLRLIPLPRDARCVSEGCQVCNFYCDDPEFMLWYLDHPCFWYRWPWCHVCCLRDPKFEYEPDAIRRALVESLRRPTLRVWFTITSLNLKYEIQVPTETTIGELAEWVNLRIIRPLARVTNASEYIDVFREAHLDNLKLAEVRNPKAVLATSTRISELTLSEDRPLVAVFQSSTMACPTHPPGPGPIYVPWKLLDLLAAGIPPYARWSWIATLIAMIATLTLIGPRRDVNGKLHQQNVPAIQLVERLR